MIWFYGNLSIKITRSICCNLIFPVSPVTIEMFRGVNKVKNYGQRVCFRFNYIIGNDEGLGLSFGFSFEFGF